MIKLESWLDTKISPAFNPIASVIENWLKSKYNCRTSYVIRRLIKISQVTIKFMIKPNITVGSVNKFIKSLTATRSKKVLSI